MNPPSPASAALRQQGIDALRAGQLDSAIEILTRCLMTSPEDGEAQACLGVAYSQKGLHEQALRMLDLAVQKQPAAAGVHFNRGVALERAGRPAEAAAAYQQAARLNPNH